MDNSMRSLKRPFVAQQEEEDAGQSSPPTKRARTRTTTISNPMIMGDSMIMGNFMRSLKRPFVAQEEEEDAAQSSPPTKRARTRTISNPLKKYRVFISHRVPDVKHSVAQHLFDMLDVRGIQTFFDIEEMEGGEVVSEQIEEAIASSKVQIVIFSKNFAESKWCLEEVRMMMEKRKEGTCTVIPVFYDVEPSEVRSMKGEFGEKLRKKHTKGETVEKIREWRKALEEVSQIAGFCFSQHKGSIDHVHE